MKQCTRCKEEKALEQFGWRSKRLNRRSPICKKCAAEVSRKWRASEIGQQYLKKWRETQVLQKASRKSHLQRRYGITQEQYEEMAIKQGYKCAICGREYPKDKHLAIDHNHKTMQVRGLLCHQCNQAYGLLYENTKIMLGMIKYHLEHSSEE